MNVKGFHSILVTLLLTPIATLSQWSNQADVNLKVNATAAWYPKLIVQQSGEIFIAWDGSGIHSQKLANTGDILWSPEDVSVGADPFYRVDPVLTTDGKGGVFVAWKGGMSGDYDVYAQRIRADGTPAWDEKGILISGGGGYQYEPEIVSDGMGGAIIVWYDIRWGIYKGGLDIFAQRIDSNGSMLWPVNSVPVCTTENTQMLPKIVSDGDGGVIVTWEDHRLSTWYPDIYAQRVDRNGTIRWQTGGVPICALNASMRTPRIITDGQGGAIISWLDGRSGETDIYAQRINPSGVSQWTSNGVRICPRPERKLEPTMAPDGHSGTIIAWVDHRKGYTDPDVYIQRIDASGNLKWNDQGILVCNSEGGQSQLAITSDSSDGAILCWVNGTIDNEHSDISDIYTQRIDADGSIRWSPETGVAITTAEHAQVRPVIISDNSGGAIVSWLDKRNGISDVYAQKVDRFGYLGNVLDPLIKVEDIPDDQGKHLKVSWRGSYLDRDVERVVTNYRLWRKNATGWTPVSDIVARSSESYEYVDMTTADSTPVSTPTNVYRVSAQSSPLSISWNSADIGGYSIDNLAPSAPLNLRTTRGDTYISFSWDQVVEADLSHYEIHRGLSYHFIPDQNTLILTITDPGGIDSTLANQTVYYYKTVAVDLNGNRGIASSTAFDALGYDGLYHVLPRWNLISLPLRVNDNSIVNLYAANATNAFEFSGGYIEQALMEPRKGYWAKFNEERIIGMIGDKIVNDTIDVKTGWNIIPSISGSVDVNTIVSEPGGMITSPFYAYDGGYKITSNIEPSRAYWVQAAMDGKLILSNTGTLNASSQIRIQAARELPPPPPDNGDAEISVNIPEHDALLQNFPNPFNPTTTISYQLPHDSWVTVKVFNMLGVEVESLVDKYQSAGVRDVSFNAFAYPSGIYVYRLQAGTFTASRKMILMK